MQKIYAWPDSKEESEPASIVSRGTVTGASAGVGAARAGVNGWHNLSPETRYMFRTRGLGGARGIRTPAMAQRLYESIPRAVRNLGEGAAKEFVNGKHASHIQSVKNAPSRAKWPSNVVWESAKKNVDRGSRNMSASQLAEAKSAIRTSAINVGLKSALKSAARAGAIVSAFEASSAGIENYFHWKRGRKDGVQAAKDTAKSTAVAGGTAAVTAGGVSLISQAAGWAGVSLSLGPAGAAVAVAGGTVLAGTTIYRIAKAAQA